MSSNLDIKKVYVDSRFKTANSKSDSDFYIELPRTFNVPDGVVAHTDDLLFLLVGAPSTKETKTATSESPVAMLFWKQN